MRAYLPEYLQKVIPETCSAEAFKQLGELRTQPHPVPPRLVLSDEKARELAKDFDSVPAS